MAVYESIGKKRWFYSYRIAFYALGIEWILPRYQTSTKHSKCQPLSRVYVQTHDP